MFESLVPALVITDEIASERLLTASSTTAIEFDQIPIVALNPARKTLARIPRILVRTMVDSRFLGEMVWAAVFMLFNLLLHGQESC